MNDCYVYLRVSDDDQVKGFSISNQERLCSEYSKSQGFEIKEVFIENGRSARTTNRPEFHRLEAAIDANPPSVVMCMKVDRMFRNLNDFSRMRKKLKNAGIKLYSINEGGDITTGLIGNIFASVAEWESEVNSDRTKAGMQQKFREGIYPGLAPLGYMNVERNERKFIEPHPIDGPIIKRMFELYATGQYSQLELCEIMYKKGLRGRRNKKHFSPQTLTGIFNNPIYYGLMRWGGMEGIGKHEPLIDKSLFDQVQHVSASNNNFLIRKRKNSFLLRGFVFCPIHNRRLLADRNDLKSGKTISYYRCSNRGGCKSSYWNTEKLERKVANLLKQYEFSAEFIKMVRSHAKEHLQGLRKDKNALKQALLNQKHGIEQKRNNIEDLVVAGTIDRDVYKRQHQQLRDDLLKIEKDLHTLANQQDVDFGVIEEVLAMTRNLYQTYMDAPYFIKRHYLRLFFDKLYIQDKKIVKICDTPIFRVLKEEQKILLRESWGARRVTIPLPQDPQSRALPIELRAPLFQISGLY